MTIIARQLYPPSVLVIEPGATRSGLASGDIGSGSTTGPNPFHAASTPSGSAEALADELSAALRSRVREVIEQTHVARLDAEAIRNRLLELYEGPGGAEDRPETVGNSHPIGSSAWLETGRKTGIWFEIPMGALDELLAGHEIRPDPSAPDLDPRADELARRYRERLEAEPGPAPNRTPFVRGIDVRAPGVRSFEQEVVLSYLLHISRASRFISQAAAVGAEREQLEFLARAALRRGRLDIHVGDDVADRLESDNHFHQRAGRQAVANQAFWLQVRAGEKDITFGNIHDLLPVAPRDSLRAFAQDSRIRLNVDAAGDRMMKELAELSRTLDLDVFDEPQKRREEVAAAIAAFRRDQALAFVRLGMSEGGHARVRALEQQMIAWVDLAYDDLDALRGQI